jgi:thioredoxin reductase
MKQVRDDDDDDAVEIHRGVAVRDVAVDSIVADGFDVEIRRLKIQQLMKMTEMVKRSNVVVVDGLETSMMTMYYVGQSTSH